jgi:hypothetical protein
VLWRRHPRTTDRLRVPPPQPRPFGLVGRRGAAPGPLRLPLDSPKNPSWAAWTPQLVARSPRVSRGPRPFRRPDVIGGRASLVLRACPRCGRAGSRRRLQRKNPRKREVKRLEAFGHTRRGNGCALFQVLDFGQNPGSNLTQGYPFNLSGPTVAHLQALRLLRWLTFTTTHNLDPSRPIRQRSQSRTAQNACQEFSTSDNVHSVHFSICQQFTPPFFRLFLIIVLKSQPAPHRCITQWITGEQLVENPCLSAPDTPLVYALSTAFHNLSTSYPPLFRLDTGRHNTFI